MEISTNENQEKINKGIEEEKGDLEVGTWKLYFDGGLLELIPFRNFRSSNNNSNLRNMCSFGNLLNT